MPNEIENSNLRELWQNQEVENVTITVDGVRRRAARFETRIRRRNVREYVAGAVVVALFLAQVIRDPGWRAIPQWLLIAGVAYALLQLHRRGSSRALPPDAGIAVSLRLHREELERQREALRSVWSWYLLPFAPGLLATLIAAALENRINAVWYICCAAFPLAFALVWELNRRAAARLGRKIDELKAMEQPEE